MTKLKNFERNAKAALMDGLEEQVEAMGETLKETAEENFKQYASENGYDIDHIWEDAELTVEKNTDGYTARVEWPGLTAIYEYGADPHPISGNPLLSFAWESPPQGTRPAGAPAYVETQTVQWGSVTGGIPESRSIRGALDFVRFQLDGRVML